VTLEVWTAFVFASTIILVIPGPTILLVISQAISHGRKAVMPLVAGVILGDFTAMTLSLLGLGAVLAASSALFSVLKWIGSLYLIYLGIKLWRTSPEKHDYGFSAAKTTNRFLFRGAFFVTALNPKSIAFFVAFLPQFINNRRETFLQFLLLEATFLFLAALNATLYAVFSGHLRDMLKNSKVRYWLNRSGGSVLICAGLATATMKRSS
jgi:threonine/homoserine/homoserine lactone efflux protein